MKKVFTFLILLLATFSATADNYFTIDGAVNDTLLLSPTLVGNAVYLTFPAHFDGRLDYWHLTLTLPVGLSYANQYTEGGDLNVPFVNRWGNDSICHADFALLQGGSIIIGSITEPGYWDPDGDGNYDTYGTVKWEAGDYPFMFKILVSIDNSFHCDTLGIDGLLSSTHDWRGGTIGSGVLFHKDIIIHVGYKLGDVNADGQVTIADVTALLNYLSSHEGLDQYQMEAADVNRNGEVTISDVTVLVNMLLQQGAINSIEDIDF